MAAKAIQAQQQFEQPTVQTELTDDILFIAVPMRTYKAISDEAAKRNLSFAVAVSQALETWLKR